MLKQLHVLAFECEQSIPPFWYQLSFLLNGLFSDHLMANVEDTGEWQIQGHQLLCTLVSVCVCVCGGC